MTAMEFAAEHGLLVMPTGSRFTVDPPVMDTDADYAVFSDSPASHVTSLKADGWDVGGSQAGGGSEDGFTSFRKGQENILLIYDDKLWLAFTAATTLARMMNLKDKRDRVDLFHTIDRLWPGTPTNKVHREVLDNLAKEVDDAFA